MEAIVIPSSDAAPQSSPSPLAAGTRVARYVILKTLGQGGMGVVYMAYDEELDRRVALKLLVAADPSAEIGARLVREAQAMARLSHPAIVAVYDVGTTGGAGTGTARAEVFLAMEYVDGVTLRAWREAAPRTVSAILTAYGRAGRGLAAAHAQGILHRDFKPENVLVDARGFAHVIDFGLARIDPMDVPLDEAALQATAVDSGPRSRPLTRAGVLLGTPEYMAPEQLRGERAEARSDVFSFSVALYEALYGERPHAGETARALLDAMTGERLRGAPKGTDVPGAVRAVLARGLRARPDDRWPSMQAMLDALDAAAGRRRKQVVAAVVFLAAAAVITVLLRAPRREPMCVGAEAELLPAWGPSQQRAVASAFAATGSPRAGDTLARVSGALGAYATSWATMWTESCGATHLRHTQPDQTLDLRTACLDQRRLALASTVDVLTKADAKLVDDAVATVHALPDIGECADVDALRSPFTMPHDPAKRRAVEVLQKDLADATALFNAQRLEAARTRAAAVLEDARKAGNRPIESAALVLLGKAGVVLDVTPSTKVLFDAALEADATRSDAIEGEAWTSLVRVAGLDLAQYDESEEYARLAESAIARSGGSITQRATLLQQRGHALFGAGKVLEAEPLYREALDIRTRVFGAESMEVASVESDLGDIRDAIGQERQSLEFYRAVLRKTIAAYGEGHPRTVPLLLDVANGLLNLGDPESALPFALQAEAFAEGERLRGVARRVVSIARIFRGEIQEGAADYRASTEHMSGLRRADAGGILAYDLLRRHVMVDALSDFERSIDLYGTIEGETDMTLLARSGHDLCLARLGRAGASVVDDARAALSAGERRANGEAHNLAYLALGEALLAVGGNAEALRVLEQVALKAEKDDENPEFHADIHLALARALLVTRGDRVRAAALAERAAGEYEGALVRLPSLARDARALSVRIASETGAR